MSATAVLAALAYVLWVIGPWLNPGLDHVNGYVSELAARDQPFSWLFRAGDLVAGTFAVVTAVMALAVRARRPPLVTIGWLGVAVFGVATIVDSGLTPMTCAPYVDTTCALAERAGTLPLTHELHAATSSVAVGGAIAGMVGLSAVPGITRRHGPTLLKLEIGATVLTLAAMLLGAYTGVAQRVQVAGISAWLVVLAVAIWHGELA